MTQNNKPLAYYIGYTTNENDRFKASSGGVGTAITRYLLNQQEYGTSITFIFNQQECRYEPRLIHSTEEINVCGSIYQDIDIAGFVRHNVDKIRDGIVLTCPPCQVTAVRQILSKACIKHFIISYCCSGQTTIEGTWKYYELIGVEKEDVVNMQYRGNGWPSGIQIWLKNGTKVYKDNYTEPWKSLHQTKLFRPKRCYFCKMDTGHTSDISLADPWLDYYKKNDYIGHTMFLINTEYGNKIIKKMNQSNLLEFVSITEDDYNIAQWNNILKKDISEKDIKMRKKMYKLNSNKIYRIIMSSSLHLLRLHLFIERVIRKI